MCEWWEMWVRSFDDLRNWLRLDLSTDYLILTHALDHTTHLLSRVDGRGDYSLPEMLSWHPMDAQDLERLMVFEDGYLATPN